MEVEHIKLLVELMQTRISILRLKSDDYAWTCYVDDKTKHDFERSLDQIDELIKELRNNHAK